jgi:hypothetical protein
VWRGQPLKVYLPNRTLPLRVRTLINFLEQRLKPTPPWEAGREVKLRWLALRILLDTGPAAITPTSPHPRSRPSVSVVWPLIF